MYCIRNYIKQFSAFSLNQDRLWALVSFYAYFFIYYFYYFKIIAHPVLNDLRPSNIHFSQVGLYKVVFCALVPTFFLGHDFRRLSNFFAWMIYLLMYLPMIVAISFDERLALNGRWQYQGVFLLGMLCILGANQTPLCKPVSMYPKLRFAPDRILFLLVILSIFSLGFIHQQVGEHLKFVHPIDHFSYTQRIASRQFFADKPLAAYLASVLGNAVVPCMIALAFLSRKWIYILFAAFIAAYLYLLASNKSFLFIVPFSILVGILGTASIQRQLSYLILFLVTTIGICTSLILHFKPVSPIEDGFWSLIYLFLYRSVAISSETVVPYLAFFKQHAHTFFAHAHGFDLFYPNPYPQGVGVAVGAYLGVNYNMSANFWLTDGIAGLGMAGVLLVSLALSFMLYFSDIITQETSTSFAMTASSGVVVGLLNSSLFSTLLSGGWIFVLCIFILTRK
jgi:hypothetical protein